MPRQPGAAPHHDWNERIERECYAPVVSARLLDDSGAVRRLMNCLEHMSFNFGPTLLEWLEANARDTYDAIVEADRRSTMATGHGNALAMAFHHTILPLSDPRDRVTEVRWGIADFRRRFGREPEGMWLPEAAVDPATLDVLAAEGIRFTILAPHQVHPLPPAGRPGLYTTPSGASMTVFAYDGAGSHAVAFGNALRDGRGWAQALATWDAEPPPGTLRLLATDGETYGHHKTFGEMALAAALETLERSDEVRLVGLGQYLSEHPATDPVRLVAPTSWSCAHGVERWRSNCGCGLDPFRASQTSWRAPLRTALEWLARGIHALYESASRGLMADPWTVRNDFGSRAGSTDPAGVRAWVRTRLDLSSDEDVDLAVRLLELERNALRLFTSCAWFFDDLARIEPVQVLRYAARALDLATGVDAEAAARLRRGFTDRLSRAESNDPEAGNGRSIYEAEAEPPVHPMALVAASHGMLARFGVPDVAPFTTYTVSASPKDSHSLEVRHVATGERASYRVGVEGDEPIRATATVQGASGEEFVIAGQQLPEPVRDLLGIPTPEPDPDPAPAPSP